jgi:hypothetical protein
MKLISETNTSASTSAISEGSVAHKDLQKSRHQLILFVCCSFIPIIILIVQNSFFFDEMIKTRDAVLKKDSLVNTDDTLNLNLNLCCGTM